MMKAAQWFILPALLLAAACSSVPRSLKLPVTVPEHFSESGEASRPAQWWLSFDDPMLNTLVESALAGNQNLLGTWDRLAQAEAVARRAGAPLWPALDASADASRTVQDTESRSASGSTRETNPVTEFSLGLAASYEIDLWGRVRSARQAAALDARVSAAELQAAAITLSALVASTWYQLVEQYGQLDLLEQQLRTNEEVLELITLRFRRGQTGAADVLQQRQLAESRRGDLAEARARVAQLEHQLAVLLGRPPREQVAERVSTLRPLPPLPETGLPVALLDQRPDLRAAYYEVLAADRRLASASADRFPRISLTARADTSSAKLRDLFDNWLATLAASLVQPLFDAGERQAEVDRTRAGVSERLHAYGQAVLEALAEVEDALAQEQRQRELIASLDKQLAISAQVIDRTRDNYLNGAVDYLRVLDVLLTHQALQRRHLQARRQLLDYRIDLCRALGGGWELARPGLATIEPAPESFPSPKSM